MLLKQFSLEIRPVKPKSYNPTLLLLFRNWAKLFIRSPWLCSQKQSTMSICTQGMSSQPFVTWSLICHWIPGGFWSPAPVLRSVCLYLSIACFFSCSTMLSLEHQFSGGLKENCSSISCSAFPCNWWEWYSWDFQASIDKSEMESLISRLWRPLLIF